MENLDLLVGHSCRQGDPICLACCRAVEVRKLLACDPWKTYKTKGMQANAIQPDLVPSGGEPPNFSLDQ
jgi:hypothetical protein